MTNPHGADDQVPLPLTMPDPPAPVIEVAPEPSPEYRYGTDISVPEWARGRTASEVLQMAQERTGAPPAPTPAPVPVALPSPGPDVRYQQQIATQNAQLAYRLAAQQHPGIFSKWGPEIDRELQKFAPEHLTPDTIDTVVTFIKGRHHDELVAERVRGIEATGLTMRSTGRAPAPHTTAFPESVSAQMERTPDSWKQHARAVGIGEAEVLEFCRSTDQTPGEFFKTFGAGIITDAVADLNLQRQTLSKSGAGD